MFGRIFLIFDHLHDEALIAGVNYEGEINQFILNDELNKVEKRLNEIMVESFDDPIFEEKESKIIYNPDDKNGYINKVNFIKKEIIAGNLFQCVPSRRIEVETDLSPITAYRNLRMKNPSPYIVRNFLTC